MAVTLRFLLQNDLIPSMTCLLVSPLQRLVCFLVQVLIVYVCACMCAYTNVLLYVILQEESQYHRHSHTLQLAQLVPLLIKVSCSPS